MSSPRVVTLCPGLVGRIEECWHPSHFREVLKSVRNSFKIVEHMKVVVVRLDTVIEISANLEALETLKEMREDLMSEITNLEVEKIYPNPRNHFKSHENKLRIFTGKKSEFPNENRLNEEEILTKNSDSITKQLTLQVYDDSKRDMFESATRLGISVGLMAHRLRSYGMIP